MCEWGDTVELMVPIPAELSNTGELYWAKRSIDRCIAPLIQALNDVGMYTSNCCCGHGKTEGTIHLHDGRVLRLNNYDLEASLCNQKDDNDPDKFIDILLQMQRSNWELMAHIMREKKITPLEILKNWEFEQCRMTDEELMAGILAYETKHNMHSSDFIKLYEDVDYRIKNFDGEDGFDFFDWYGLLEALISVSEEAQKEIKGLMYVVSFTQSRIPKTTS